MPFAFTQENFLGKNVSRWKRNVGHLKIILGDGRSTMDEPWQDHGGPTVARDDRILATKVTFKYNSVLSSCYCKLLWSNNWNLGKMSEILGKLRKGNFLRGKKWEPRRLFWRRQREFPVFQLCMAYSDRHLLVTSRFVL